MNTLSFNTGTDLEQIPKELLKTSTLYRGKDPLLLMRRLNVSEARKKRMILIVSGRVLMLIMSFSRSDFQDFYSIGLFPAEFECFLAFEFK